MQLTLRKRFPLKLEKNVISRMTPFSPPYSVIIRHVNITVN